MKTILILTTLFTLNTAHTSRAEAKQYVVHVNHASNIQPDHTVLNTLLQKDITIDTATKTIKVRLNQNCTLSNICPEMLKFYRLDIKKMGSLIQAEGSLPLHLGPLQTPGKVMMTMEKNFDNATVVKISDANGTSILIASPMEETSVLF